MNTRSIVSLQNVSKVFNQNSTSELTILNGINIEIKEGQKVAIVGPSGSGKSTLLSLLAGLDTATSGQVLVAGKSLTELSDKDMSNFRNQDISIIFQSFELIAPFTVTENIIAPLDIRREKVDQAKQNSILEAVGLSHRSDSFPATLSGGEKQRTAIARALLSDAKVILADEPTGSLDRTTGQAVLELLMREVSNKNKTLVIITHDPEIAKIMDRVLVVRDGTIYEESK